MPTKQELLEELNVKELKQMAREENLSGYSKMRKSELVSLVKNNYTKDKIKNWRKRSGSKRSTESLGEKLQNRKWIVFGVGISIFAILAGLTFSSLMGSSGVASAEYVNENYNFSFSYPSNWVENTQYTNPMYRSYTGLHLMVTVKENIPNAQAKAVARISISENRGKSLDNIQNSYSIIVENNENIEDIYSEIKTVSGSPAFEYSLQGNNTRQHGLFIITENYLYRVRGLALNTVYDDYKQNFDQIINTFTLSS